tara:strand:+ start:1258 stop:1449 length:192 start_codon:yes stop_codon:yes gene_type:complete
MGTPIRYRKTKYISPTPIDVPIATGGKRVAGVSFLFLAPRISIQVKEKIVLVGINPMTSINDM